MMPLAGRNLALGCEDGLPAQVRLSYIAASFKLIILTAVVIMISAKSLTMELGYEVVYDRYVPVA